MYIYISVCLLFLLLPSFHGHWHSIFGSKSSAHDIIYMGIFGQMQSVFLHNQTYHYFRFNVGLSEVEEQEQVTILV